MNRKTGGRRREVDVGVRVIVGAPVPLRRGCFDWEG